MTKNYASKVIRIAKGEIGYLEKSATAYQKNKTILDKKEDGAGSDNYTKYARDMHEIYPEVMDFPAPWCDCFVDWCFYKAYGIATAKSLLNGNFDDYTVASAQMYKNKNAWYTKDPKVGDQIFFKNASGGICHTGLVINVSGGRVYTIEGNTSSKAGVVANGGAVNEKSYSLTYNRIAGYGRPKYDLESAPVKKDPAPAVKSTHKAKDSAQLFDKALAGTYKTTSNLNMRHGAGTSKQLMVTLPKGTKVKNYGYYSNASDKSVWLYVHVTLNGVTYTGFCSKKYLSK